MKIIFFYWHFPKASKNVMNISFDISKKCYEDLAGVFFKRAALKNFARFTGKHLWWSLFLIKRHFNIGVFL